MKFPGQTSASNVYHIVYATRSLSPGINYVRVQYKVIAVIPPGTADQFNLLPGYLSKYPVPSNYGKLFFQIRPVYSLNGFQGTISTFHYLVNNIGIGYMAVGTTFIIT
jgi:hypothetical protein